MAPAPYANGDEVGDVLDVGQGNGPRMRVVVVIPTGEAAEGFDASQWAYLKDGVVLHNTKVFGLLHLKELDHERVPIQRAQATRASARLTPTLSSKSSLAICLLDLPE